MATDPVGDALLPIVGRLTRSVRKAQVLPMAVLTPSRFRTFSVLCADVCILTAAAT